MARPNTVSIGQPGRSGKGQAERPERAGLDVRFSEFRVGPPSGRDLHDLS